MTHKAFEVAPTSEDDVVLAELELFAETSITKVSAPADSKPKDSHPQRYKSQNLRAPDKAKLLLDSKLLLSRQEAAQVLSISIRGVDYLIATKRLFTRRIGTRVLIPVEAVRRFARSDHPERMAG